MNFSRRNVSKGTSSWKPPTSKGGPPDSRTRTASVGGFAVDEDIDHEELAEQLGVGIMHVQEMYKVFLIYTKGSWEIKIPDLGALCRSLGVNPTEEEVTDMINEMDDDVSGMVQFPEFARYGAACFNAFSE